MLPQPRRHIAALLVRRPFHHLLINGSRRSDSGVPSPYQLGDELVGHLSTAMDAGDAEQGGDLRVAGLTSPSMGSLPQKGQGFKVLALISSTFLSSVDAELMLAPATLGHMDARLMLDLSALALHIEGEECERVTS